MGLLGVFAANPMEVDVTAAIDGAAKSMNGARDLRHRNGGRSSAEDQLKETLLRALSGAGREGATPRSASIENVFDGGCDRSVRRGRGTDWRRRECRRRRECGD